MVIDEGGSRFKDERWLLRQEESRTRWSEWVDEAKEQAWKKGGDSCPFYMRILLSRTHGGKGHRHQHSKVPIRQRTRWTDSLTCQQHGQEKRG